MRGDKAPVGICGSETALFCFLKAFARYYRIELGVIGQFWLLNWGCVFGVFLRRLLSSEGLSRDRVPVGGL